VPAYFFDSSSLVKRYVAEVGTAWVQEITRLGARNAIYVARITGVEVVSAIVRRQRGGGMSWAFAALLLGYLRHDLARQYRPVAVTPRLLSQAMALAETHGLRGYDAVQLAATLGANNARVTYGRAPLTLVSADAELSAAATAEGLVVDDPNAHP